MPGHYVHFLFSPACTIHGDPRIRPDSLVGDMPVGGRQGVGSLLFISTPSQKLLEYLVFHSYTDYAMGVFLRRWQPLGTVQSYYKLAAAHCNEDVAGRIHLEGY